MKMGKKKELKEQNYQIKKESEDLERKKTIPGNIKSRQNQARDNRRKRTNTFQLNLRQKTNRKNKCLNNLFGNITLTIY